MTAPARFKVCGLTRPGDVDAAAAAGAAYLGFVFFPKSPRHLEIDAAAALAGRAPPGVAKVALTVDANDATLAAILARVPIDILQLHGRESPERVAEVRARFRLPVMKALGVAGPDDLAAVDAHGEVADMLLLDAKPPEGAAVPGGNGVAFDWRLVANRRWPRPWMLAGGLTPATVAEAVMLTGAPQVDVSSGVETAPGLKDADRIAAFARALGPAPRATAAV